MRVVLAGLMLAAAFSGCLGGSDAGDVGDAVPTGDAGLNATAPNRSPLANLTADALNGTAPLNVTFTLAFSDADQDNLTWTLTLGNTSLANGTSLPASSDSTGNSSATASGNATGNATGPRASSSSQVTHQFTEAGNYTVVLNVTDGTNSTLANVTITVLAGNATAGAGEGAVAEDDNVVFNADGTCDAKGEVSFGVGYAHDRGLGSLWIYEESNDIAGLQVGGSGEEAAYTACLNPDTLRF